MREEVQRDPDYGVDPGGMKQSIEWYLDPVIKRVRTIDSGFSGAHEEISQAFQSQAQGWFSGEGNGTVRAACGSFLNETEWQLRQLVMEHTELAESLEEYRTALQTHIQGAKNRETAFANRFLAIERELEAKGY